MAYVVVFGGLITIAVVWTVISQGVSAAREESARSAHDRAPHELQATTNLPIDVVQFAAQRAMISSGFRSEGSFDGQSFFGYRARLRVTVTARSKGSGTHVLVACDSLIPNEHRLPNPRPLASALYRLSDDLARLDPHASVGLR